MTDPTPQNADLFRQAQHGDARAFEALIEPHATPLVLLVSRLAAGRLGPDADADDLLQTVLARAWKLLPEIEFRGDRPLYAWLVALARGALQDRGKYVRAKNRAGSRHLESETDGRRAFAEPAAPMTSVATSMQRREECERLAHALAGLPPKYRDVIEQHVLEARSLGEIAATLDLTKNAVWERLHRGMARLREDLGAMRPSTVP